ncbi:MAG: aldehyde dehydrogenase family protein, partial [Mesorhizobium sp.]
AWREEVFGPVLSVRFYDDLGSAIRSANDTQYGLSAYVFGESPDAIHAASATLDAGFVAINAFCEGDFTTPFGGFKTSGFGGKDKGIHSLDQYSRTKSIWWAT